MFILFILRCLDQPRSDLIRMVLLLRTFPYNRNANIDKYHSEEGRDKYIDILKKGGKT